MLFFYANEPRFRLKDALLCIQTRMLNSSFSKSSRSYATI